MTIGALTLNPEFESGTLDYTTTTTNATNTITATVNSGTAEAMIKVGEVVVDNGAAATWGSGANTVTIKVTDGSSETIYTVTVTKE